MNKLIYSFLGACALAVLPAQASIITNVMINGTSATEVSYFITKDNANGAAVGNNKGNDDQSGGGNGLASLNLLSSLGQFGGTDTTWTTAFGNLEGSTGATSGTFYNDEGYNTGGNAFAISLKGGTGYYLYYFDTLTSLDSAWDIAYNTSGIVNKGGNTAGLSHASLYLSNKSVTGGTTTGGTTTGGTTTGGTTTGGTTGATPVPEPSTYAMFGLATAMLGFISYRSRNRRS